MKTLAYHITWGTYGTRLHGDPRGTVDRQHNEYGTPVPGYDEHRWELEKSNLKFPPIRISHEQMIFIERTIPELCVRGYWTYHTCAAVPDHVHSVITSTHEPEATRRLLKRWLGQEMSMVWPLSGPDATWWAECGSIKHIRDEDYFARATNYVARQRASPSVAKQ